MPSLMNDDSFGNYHVEAVGEIYDAGFELLDETADDIDDIMTAAEDEAALLEEEAELARIGGDEELAEALELDAIKVIIEAILACIELTEERAEEGSDEMLGMCANDGQTTIIESTLQSYAQMMHALAPGISSE